MSTTRTATETAPLLPRTPAALLAPIIVASDGGPDSEPALLAARLLASRIGAPVRLVSVVTPQSFLMPAPDGIALPLEPVADLVATRRDELRDAMTRVLGGEQPWPVEIHVGVAALELADAAESSRAQLIVAGLAHKDRLERLLRGDTPLAVLNSASVPILVVPPGEPRLPRRVVIAVDLTDASVDAARQARLLLDDVEEVHLVHVQVAPEPAPPMMAPTWNTALRETVRRAFSRVIAALQLKPTVRLETHILSGHVAGELLDFADLAKADLLVLGHRQRPLVERLFSTGVGARVFRGTSIWTLMVPERDRGRDQLSASLVQAGDAVNARLGDRAEWAAYLAEFSLRNAGRRVTLEIHNYQIGAQTTVCGYPLSGVAYDRHGGRVDIMLGESDDSGQHLTHAVRRVQRIQVYRLPDGRDGALRVSDRLGDTLLTLAR